MRSVISLLITFFNYSNSFKQETMSTNSYNKYVAEFLGTLVLVLMGCGSAVLAGSNGTTGVGLLGISFAFGLSVIAMAYTIGHISGCHINPAITIGMVVVGRMKGAESIGYIISQILHLSTAVVKYSGL